MRLTNCFFFLNNIIAVTWKTKNLVTKIKTKKIGNNKNIITVLLNEKKN